MSGQSESGVDRKRRLDRERELALEDIKRQKDAIIAETARNRVDTGRFTAKTDSLEDHLKVETEGLVTAAEFAEKRKELEDRKQREAARSSELKAEESRRKKEKKKKRSTLSFGFEEEEGTGGESSQQDVDSAVDSPKPSKRAKIGKNPTVDTSYLPDREREEAERREREAIRQDWLKKQEETKQEVIDVIFAYYDGHGHRAEVKCKKGETIGQFLERARAEFPQLSRVSLDNLMFIKEDLIIPHHFTFYDFIINKTQGKTGPLFDFSEREDVRVLHDATVEKDESHAGKVVERAWYNRNKHIFPASRWEAFDPDKKYGVAHRNAA